MPKKILQIQVFVSCPSDVEEETKIVREACKNLTNILDEQNIHVKVIHWKKDVIPLITGQGAQSVINDQLETIQKYAGTLLHEVAHAQSRAPDINSEFEQQLTRIIGMIISSTLQ